MRSKATQGRKGIFMVALGVVVLALTATQAAVEPRASESDAQASHMIGAAQAASTVRTARAEAPAGYLWSSDGAGQNAYHWSTAYSWSGSKAQSSPVLSRPHVRTEPLSLDLWMDRK